MNNPKIDIDVPGGGKTHRAIAWVKEGRTFEGNKRALIVANATMGRMARERGLASNEVYTLNQMQQGRINVTVKFLWFDNVDLMLQVNREICGMSLTGWPKAPKADWRPDETIPEDDYAIFPVDETEDD